MLIAIRSGSCAAPAPSRRRAMTRGAHWLSVPARGPTGPGAWPSGCSITRPAQLTAVPAIWIALLQQGHRIGEPRVAQLMRQDGIRATTVKTWRATTPSPHRYPLATHILNRPFTVTSPNRGWAGDLPSVWTTEGWRSLAVSLDLYPRLVLGWAMGHRLTMELAEQVLPMALANRSPRAGLRHHSDRGSPYAATDDQRLLGTHGIITSMSRTGNGGDNACVESVFATLTRELVYPQHDATRDEARPDIFESIELFDNRTRRHSTLGYNSTAEYEARTVVA